jgi:hypothetical protein
MRNSTRKKRKRRESVQDEVHDQTRLEGPLKNEVG